HHVDVGLVAETGHGKRQRPGIGIVPTRLEELAAVPANVGHVPLVYLAVKETGAVNGGMAFAEVDHELPEPEQAAVFLHLLPVEPAQWAVLAIGVVVALLRAADLIARQNHG